MCPKSKVRKEADTKTLATLFRMFPKTPGWRKRVEKFRGLCYAYADAYRVDIGDAPPAHSGARRTELHDQVMEVVQKLFSQPDAHKQFGASPPDRVLVRELILGHEKRYRRKAS